LSPRNSPSLSLFSKNRLITKPSRLTLGFAAATVVAVAGVAIGTAAGPSSGGSLPAALNKAGVSVNSSPSASPYSIAIPSAAGRASKHAGHPKGSGHPSANGKTALNSHAGGHAAAAKHAAPAAKSAAHHRAPAPKPPAKPYLMYDSVIPSAIPAHHVAAAYATGPYTASPSQLAGKGPVVWIDTIGSDPAASALDVEPGDATPQIAATWARNRLSSRPHAVARIYTMISEWPAVKAAVAALPQGMQSRIRWWIADPTGVAHLVPGSDATQWYWGTSYDISTATPRF
jgi:hypothetical protein